MGQTLSAADAILKDLYVGPIVEMLNQKTYMLDQIQRDSNSVDHTGRRAIVPVHSNRNRGRTSMADGGTLPLAGQQAWQDAIINIAYHAYGIQLTDASIQATTRNEGAFVSLLEAETKGVAKDMKKDINRQVFGQCDSNSTPATGKLGTCGTTSATTTVTMGSAFDVQYIQVGDKIDIRTDSTGAAVTNGTSRTVTARSVSGPTVTIADGGGNVTTASTESVYLAGSRGNEMYGLRFQIGATSRSLFSINSATAGNEFWNPTVTSVGSSSSAPALAGESNFEKLIDDVGQNGNGEVDVFVTTRGIRRRLADQYQSQKRFNDAQAVRINGGFSAIMVNETPVVFDDDCPKQWVFGVNKDSFRWFQQTSPGWLESKDGTVFQLQPNAAGTSATYNAVWLAWFRWYAALACVAPNRNGALKFCTDDNPS